MIAPLISDLYKEKQLFELIAYMGFSIIIFALYHNEFKNIKEKTLANISHKDTIIFDLTNTLSGSNIYNL